MSKYKNSTNAIGVEVYCHDCERETRYNDADDAERDCPNVTYRCDYCGSENVHRSRFIMCKCGTTVYLEQDPEECPNCGTLYNLFGQELKPRSEWDEDDNED